MARRSQFRRGHRDLMIQGAIGVVIATAILVLSPGIEQQATDSGSTEAVVDPAAILTEPERQYLTNAVIDVRERTPYYATILVADRMADRSPEEIADAVIDQTAPEGQVDAILVMAPGTPPAVALALEEGDVDDLPVTDARGVAEEAAQQTAAEDGLPQGGLAFTAALVEGPPGPTTD